MAVRVDEPRQHEPVGHVEHLDVRGEAGLDALDHPSAHQDVRGRVEAPRSPTTQQQIRHGQKLATSTLGRAARAQPTVNTIAEPFPAAVRRNLRSSTSVSHV